MLKEMCIAGLKAYAQSKEVGFLFRGPQIPGTAIKMSLYCIIKVFQNVVQNFYSLNHNI